jgi:predicted lipoprotein
MKKLLMIVAVLGLVSCNEATEGETATTDSTAVEVAVTPTATTVEEATTVTEADSTACCATDTTAAE